VGGRGGITRGAPALRPVPGALAEDVILESWMLDKSGSIPATNSCNRWLQSRKLFLAGRLSLELLELPNGAHVDQVSKLGSNFK